MSESVCGNYAINIYYWRNVLKMQVTLETSIITAWTTRIPSPLSLHLKDFCREFISIMPHCFQIILIILLSLSNPIHIKFYRLKFCFHIWRDAAIDLHALKGILRIPGILLPARFLWFSLFLLPHSQFKINTTIINISLNFPFVLLWARNATGKKGLWKSENHRYLGNSDTEWGGWKEWYVLKNLKNKQHL